MDKKKLTFKIKHLFERDVFEDDDYISVYYDMIDFISSIMGRDVNKDKFIKELTNKYFEIIEQ